MNVVASAAVAALFVLLAAPGCAQTPATSEPTTADATMKTQPAPITTTQDLLRRLQALPCVESAEAETTVGLPEANAPTYETGRAMVVVKASADLGRCAAYITSAFPGVMIGHELEPSHMLVVGTAGSFHVVDTFLRSASGTVPDSFRRISSR